jgi:hypothetical protein
METPVLVQQEKVWTLPAQYVPEIVSALRSRLLWAEVSAAFMPDGFVVFDTVDGLVRMDPETAAPIFPEPEGEPPNLLEHELLVDEFEDVEGLDPLGFWRDQDETTFEIRMSKGNWRHRSWKKHRNTQYHPLPSSGSKWDRSL